MQWRVSIIIFHVYLLEVQNYTFSLRRGGKNKQMKKGKAGEGCVCVCACGVHGILTTNVIQINNGRVINGFLLLILIMGGGWGRRGREGNKEGGENKGVRYICTKRY